jgi:TolA-binding protein
VPGPAKLAAFVKAASMEVNQLKRQLKDLEQRIDTLRGFL